MRTSRSGSSLLGITVVLAAALAACAPVGPDVGLAEEEIVNGTRETGYTSVLLLYNRSGGLCTASIISPRVVLTARHCVTDGGGSTVAPASSISLYVGSSDRSLTAEYRAAEIHVIPGSGGGIGDGRAQDVALIVLASPAREAPMEIARTSPGSLVGRDITAVGFGQTPTGSAGTKYRTTAAAEGYRDGLIYVEPAVCSGDSGGPILGADGLIYGVASFIYSPDGREPRCGTAPGVYNEFYRHLGWLDGVLEAVGDSCIPDAEICDGLDNDCDEMVDEGCSPLGAGCADSSTCIGGLCSATLIGQICTQECDTSRPALGCPPGFYCGAMGCAGRCVPGAAGALAIGATCTANVDCGSLFCADPGDGMRRCLEPCRVGLGRCLSGEICVPTGDQCGGCIDERIVSGLGHGLGEPCGEDMDCTSGMCRESHGLSECVAPCGAGCPMGFSCSTEMLCVRNRAQGIGGPCTDNADCGGGICAVLGDRSWCTVLCDAPSDCPPGFLCEAAGGASVCAPEGGLVGEDCGENADCGTGICAFDGGGGSCTAFCDADNACGAGFECRRTADGTSAVCVRPSTGGGCAVDRGARLSGLLLAVPALVLLGLAFRRRRR